jgi:anti-anti-sigma factor
MLRLTIQELGNTTIFRCAGRMVAGETEPLRTAVLQRPRVRTLVLDLAGVSVLDAAGLGALVSLRNAVQVRGARFKLLNLTPRLEALLDLTGLRPHFEVCSVRDMMVLMCRGYLKAAGRSAEPISAGRRLKPAAAH